MEEASENGKELSHSAHGNGMNENVFEQMVIQWSECTIIIVFFKLFHLVVCVKDSFLGLDTGLL
jgi:hypothetical protein